MTCSPSQQKKYIEFCFQKQTNTGSFPDNKKYKN